MNFSASPDLERIKRKLAAEGITVERVNEMAYPARPTTERIAGILRAANFEVEIGWSCDPQVEDNEIHILVDGQRGDCSVQVPLDRSWPIINWKVGTKFCFAPPCTVAALARKINEYAVKHGFRVR